MKCLGARDAPSVIPRRRSGRQVVDWGADVSGFGNKKARTKLARWGRLHPYSVSRQETVRYQLTVKGSEQGNSGGKLRPS